MNTINLKTPKEINNAIADRLRAIRKRQKFSQKELSERSGVSLGSIKRFESTGDISLISLTKLAMALNLSEDMEELFDSPKINSIRDIIDGQ